VRKTNKLSLSIATVAALAASVPVLAQSDLVASRIASYRELGAAFKNVTDEMRKSAPSPIMIRMAARDIKKMASQQYNLFPEGSNVGKTKALPAIWRDPAGFKNAQDNFAAAANTFVTSVNSGDTGKIRTATRELGGSCKACHTKYRLDE